MIEREIRHFHLFCGIGGGARGFNRGHARVGQMVARFRCIGGVDVDPAAVRDFERLSRAPGTVLDLFSREQYVAFHGTEPPPGWREATPEDLRRAAGNERPHIVFTSPPCKGFSGLLPERRARSACYQALNQLTVRGIWLALEAWADDPPEFFILENVPRIATRGRALLDEIAALLRSYGYAVAETTHDCGELGGLAQTRKRFLMVARHQEKVPPFLYEPHRRPLQAVGDVLGRMPLPGDEAAGPMHRMPALQWKTWVRLAFVEAGKDWRSLERLRVVDGVLADYALVPAAAWQRGILGVVGWREAAGTVTGNARPGTGRFSVADPRLDGTGRRYNNVYRVVRWDEVSPAVTGGTGPTAGGIAVADPRWRGREYGQYGVRRWDEPSGTISGQSAPGGGRYAVADPRVGMTSDRPHYRTGGQYGVVPWDAQTGAVTASAQHDSGRWSVADPRVGWAASAHRAKLRVTRWDQPAGTVTGSTRPASGAPSVADPRLAAAGPAHTPEAGVLPDPTDRLVALIVAEDGTWHRPFTTLELAALQGLIDPEEQLELDGLSDSAWRERIGNAVPPPAAAAIASVIGQTLLLAWSGETFVLSSQPIWVRPIAVAVAVPENAYNAF